MTDRTRFWYKIQDSAEAIYLAQLPKRDPSEPFQVSSDLSAGPWEILVLIIIIIKSLLEH